MAVNPVDMGKHLRNCAIKFRRNLTVNFECHQHIDKGFVLIDGNAVFACFCKDTIGNERTPFCRNARCSVILDIIFDRDGTLVLFLLFWYSIDRRSVVIPSFRRLSPILVSDFDIHMVQSSAFYVTSALGV